MRVTNAEGRRCPTPALAREDSIDKTTQHGKSVTRGSVAHIALKTVDLASMECDDRIDEGPAPRVETGPCVVG